jgi:hypothetical protein
MEKINKNSTQDAGSMLSQKTNEDFNKKKPVPTDLSQSKTYQKDKINANPDTEASLKEKAGVQDSQHPKDKTHESNGEEFIDKK